MISLYLVDIGLPRDHPKTVRRRLIGVVFVCILAPLFLWLVSKPGNHSLLAVLGVRFNLGELIASMFVSAILVALLFLGSILQAALGPTGWAGLGETIRSERTDIAIRNFIVAPLAEELIFRSCMVALLLPHLGPIWTTVFAPGFFGLAHVHHAVGRVRSGGVTPSQAAVATVLQVGYTSLFGIFSGVILIRTGHLAAAVVAHVLCNIMGFPDFYAIPEQKQPLLISTAYVGGLVSFLLLIFPLTSPVLFTGYPS